MSLCFSHLPLILLFFKITSQQSVQLQPSSFSSTSILKKVKSLLFPKIPSQKPFDIYLMTCLNEKVSFVENLVIHFCSQHHNCVDCIWPAGTHARVGPSLNEWLDMRCEESFLKTHMPSSLNCWDNTGSSSIQLFLEPERLGDNLLNCSCVLLLRG